jgi:hypothetical protein
MFICVLIIYVFCCFFFFFWWDWDLKSGLHNHKAGSLLLAIPAVHFALLILEMGVSRILCPGWPLIVILQISASQVARITGMSHWRQALAALGLQ